jgi:hypothetical protein
MITSTTGSPLVRQVADPANPAKQDFLQTWRRSAPAAGYPECPCFQPFLLLIEALTIINLVLSHISPPSEKQKYNPLLCQRKSVLLVMLNLRLFRSINSQSGGSRRDAPDSQSGNETA